MIDYAPVIVDESGYRRVIVSSDWHIPNLSQHAWEWWLGMVEKRRRDTDAIFLIGDVADFKPFGRFIANPMDLTPGAVLESIEMVRKAFKELRSVVRKAPIYWLMGNHEIRLQRYLYKQAPALAGLDSLSIANLTRCGEFGVTVLNTEAVLLKREGGEVYLTHGKQVRRDSGASALQEMLFWGASGLSGHTHRAGIIYRTFPNNRTIFWVETGCLCGPDMDYAPTPNWQHAFVELVYNNGYSPYLEVKT